MPTYDMKNVKTGEVEEMFLKISEKEAMVESGEWVQVLAPLNIISQQGSTLSKTDNGWRDILKTIKKNSGRGNTIKT